MLVWLKRILSGRLAVRTQVKIPPQSSAAQQQSSWTWTLHPIAAAAAASAPLQIPGRDVKKVDCGLASQAMVP